MTIVWASAMETGIQQMDLQHQELVKMINKMVVAHASRQSTTALDALLPRLIDYAMFHFGEEEALLAQVAEGTAFAEHHLQEHRSFADEIQRLIASRARQSDHDVAEVLILYLSDWLVLHISGSDHALGRMLRGKSASPTFVVGADI